MRKTAICDLLAMHTLGLLHLPYSQKNQQTVNPLPKNTEFIISSMNTERFLSEHGSNGIIKQQLTALASAWWASLSINNKRIIYQQLLFRTLQTVIYDKFSSSLSLSFFCLKMSKNALRWQDGKMASEISNFLARTQENFFWQKFFSCVRTRDLQKTPF